MERRKTSVIGGCGLITVAAALLIAAVLIFFDNRCYRNLRQDLLIYPGAVLLADSHEFIGRSRIIYMTSDPPDVVSEWYQRERALLLRRIVESGGGNSPAWANLYSVEPQDDGGSRIVFALRCY